ncbi:MAG: hypothetical protein DCF22_08230 [Leptolyngbya sp.]|nr:MAG: hypothetical protein DCF22_08230 [Leptolyngbya sp.]
MFQDASTNPDLPNSPDAVAEAKSETDGFSSSSYADRLMDDLFQDVEQLLHGESIRSQPADLSSQPISKPESASSSETAPPVPLSAPTEELSDPSVSSALATLLKSLSANQPDEQIARIPETATIATSGSVVAPQNRTSSSVYDRLLLAVGCVSIVISLALWLFYQESRRPQVVSSVPVAETAANPVTSTQNQFSDYAQKALQSIDQRSQQNMPATSTAGATAAGVAVPGMPTVTVPKAVTSGAIAPSRVATGLERVYVPVYQFPSNFKPPNSVTPLPTGAAPSAVPKYGAPARKPAAAATSPITPGAPRRLAGVLELGDRSVALFEINGVTQRYGIGESIGSSGWSLVEVSKEQAMIRRNGEVRSVFVGQNF